ncbi:hypothetical protein ACHAWF_007088 [Thalassiosira exigua]
MFYLSWSSNMSNKTSEVAEESESKTSRTKSTRLLHAASDKTPISPTSRGTSRDIRNALARPRFVPRLPPPAIPSPARPPDRNRARSSFGVHHPIASASPRSGAAPPPLPPPPGQRRRSSVAWEGHVSSSPPVPSATVTVKTKIRDKKEWARVRRRRAPFWALSMSAPRLLRTAAAVLTVTYVILLSRLHGAARQETEGPRNLGGSPLPGPEKGPSAAPGGAEGCARAVLCPYLCASLPWILVLRAARGRPRREKRRSLGKVAASLAVALAAFGTCCGEGARCPARSSAAGPTLGRGSDPGGHLVVASGSNSSSLADRGVRILFSLRAPDEVPYPDAFALRSIYKCGDRPDLPPSLARRTVLNFTVAIETDLKIGFIGDSIAAQFSQAFDAAALGRPENYERRWSQLDVEIPDEGWKRECHSATSPVTGGGVSSFWSVYDMLSATNQRRAYRCAPDH